MTSSSLNLPRTTVKRLAAKNNVFVGKVKTNAGEADALMERSKATRGKMAGLKLLVKFQDMHEANSGLCTRIWLASCSAHRSGVSSAQRCTGGGDGKWVMPLARRGSFPLPNAVRAIAHPDFPPAVSLETWLTKYADFHDRRNL